MKKLSQLFFVLAMLLSLTFVACGSDDDNKDGDGLEIQDYTSFTIENTLPKGENFYYIKIAYKNSDSNWITIADLGHLEDNKPSKEIKLTKFHAQVRLFCKFYIDKEGVYYYDFELKENRKNILKIVEGMQFNPVIDLSDPKQYPQE